MSWRMVERVMEYSRTQGAARMLLLTVAALADDDGICRYGWTRVAKAANLSRSRYYALLAGVTWCQEEAAAALLEAWPPERMAARAAELDAEILIAPQVTAKGGPATSWLWILPYVGEPPRERRKRQGGGHAARQSRTKRAETVRSGEHAARLRTVG